MDEKILCKGQNGMLMLLLWGAIYLLAVLGVVFGAIESNAVLASIAAIWLCVGWVPFMGLKILKPQEALALTLFGKYVGTLKNIGFYYVNPFCTAVNPAAKTKLNQSGDVDSGSGQPMVRGVSGMFNRTELVSKKVSLKIMTLNNARQKINDCLGNPVKIGIAVMWRVGDTAKAVFTVDNYKEYLSLQCDSALRGIISCLRPGDRRCYAPATAGLRHH